ncbi:MAG: ATP-dependent sacrificial sulfur transferase LarE [Desulfotalea sp.]
MYEAQQKLIKHLKTANSLIVAFSGGVDSCLLAYLANQVLQKKMLAITIRTPYTPPWEIDDAIFFAKKYNIPHEILELPIPEIILNNPNDRCYLCKKELFINIINRAKELDITMVIDGSNHDDLNDYRPGIKALKELEIKSPMLELGITKKQIREISKELGLNSWDKPASACLLSRLPYGTRITKEELQRIAASELFLKSLGINGARVRSHGEIARIEVTEQTFTTILTETVRKKISQKLKSFGYTFVAIDLDNFVSGSMNRSIKTEE